MEKSDEDPASVNLRFRRFESFDIVVNENWPSSENLTQESVDRQLTEKSNKIVFPGDLICAAQGDAHESHGTRLKCGWIVSTLMGRVKIHRETRELISKYPPFSKYSSTNTFVEVRPVHHIEKEPALKAGQRVFVKISYVTTRFARCIVLLNEQLQSTKGKKYRGIIRMDDAGGSSDVRIDEKFQTNDIVLALWTGEKNGRRWRINVAQPGLGLGVVDPRTSNVLTKITRAQSATIKLSASQTNGN